AAVRLFKEHAAPAFRGSCRTRPESAPVSAGRYSGIQVGRLDPFVGPVADCDDRRLERATLIGQLVFDAHRGGGKHVPSRHTFDLQLPQPLGEHAIADIGDVFPDLVISGFAGEHCADYRAGPAATNQLDRLVILGANRLLAHILYVSGDAGIDNSYLSKYSNLSRVINLTLVAAFFSYPPAGDVLMFATAKNDAASAVEKLAGTWKIDPAHSGVEVVVTHLMISKVRGRFSDISGTVVTDGTPEGSRIEAEIGTASITTNDAGRDTHLRSADFFDVETYPKIRFVSTAVKSTGHDEFIVTGDLTIR